MPAVDESLVELRHAQRVGAELEAPGSRGAALLRRLAGVLVTVLALTPGVARADEALSLEAALRLALAHNERAAKAPLRVEAARGNLARARSAFLPTIVGQGAGAWNFLPESAGRGLSASGAVSLNQPLLNLPGLPLYAQAKHNLAAEQWGASEDLRVLGFDTANAFLTVLAQEQLLVAAQQRMTRASNARDDSAARAEAGLVSTNDVTRAAIALATASSQVAEAKGNRERAYLQLGYLIGQKVTGPLVAPDQTTNNARRGNWHMEDTVRNAEARRPDVKAAAERSEALRNFAKEPLYRLLPSLGVSAQLRELIDPLPGDVQTAASAQLALTWTIYDAGARYADRRIRRAQAESGALDEKALRRSVATDISVALAALRASREVFRIAEEAVVMAQKNTEETEILYKQGLAKAIEFTEANASRYEAEVTRATAKLTMEQAYLNLRYALGLGPVSETLAKPEPPSGGPQ